ncbi:ABC transporter substrate-binding protein [Candidatus Nitrosocosmicus hydrocola]|uniref:ABC transporter substrate-binding protein n=1 Tax=Candidatus Nitrosocosmicus hydrocola TaxID=1826872 RepID=UPI0011E60101|nr:ABC transporter substrate-binding protein [Candidatus Nitrosocosmicus hydrocola]
MKNILVIVSFLLIIGILFVSFSSKSAFSVENKSGGYADQIKFIRFSNENVAYQQVSNGQLDAYFFQIPLQLVEIAKKNPNLKVFEKEGLSYGLLINPSNSSNSFNPFSLKEVRFALNFLIDRNFIVNNILKGFGEPIVEPYGSASPEYHNILPIIDPLKIRYDASFAQNMINDAMTKVGATQDTNGKYSIGGKPVTVKILIRNDDLLRKSFGDYVAAEVAKIGFTVTKEYGDLTKANRIVYGSDPANLEWNMYTESLISNSFLRYNPGTVTQMYAPWFGSMPGSQNPAFWQYTNSTIDNTTQKLIFNNFTSEGERNELLQKAEAVGIEEAVRLFFARSYDPYISSSHINGLINDYSVGIANKLSLLNALKNNTDNSTLNIGMIQIYQGAWNNVNGCSDFYCRIIYSLIADSPIFSNPYSGDPEPLRNTWSNVISNGYNDTVPVSEKSILWDPYNQSWENSGSLNNSALTKVTIAPSYSKWHSGVPIDKYDLLYSYYFPYEWSTDTKNDDLTYDAEYASLVFPTLSLIKGIEFHDNGTFDTYVDLWHYDKKQVPPYGTLWPSEPWDITAATERLVTGNKLSYSKSDANIKGIDQLSLNLPIQSELIRGELAKMVNEKYIPNSLKGLVSLDYVLDRYDASIQWIDEHHNAVIGSGPYFLDEFNPSGGVVTIKAFRDPTYPIKTGQFSYFESPPELIVQKIDVPKFIRIGQQFDFAIELSIKNSSNEYNPFRGMIDYFVTDRNNEQVITGELHVNDSKSHNSLLNNTVVKQNATNPINIHLNSTQTSELIPGPSKLKLIITTLDSPKPTIHESTLIARP